MKLYLLNPMVLTAPVPKRLLLLYLAIADNSVGVVLAQHNETGWKEKVVYYLSRIFVEYKKKYS